MKNWLLFASIGFVLVLAAIGVALGFFAPWAFGYFLVFWLTALIFGLLSGMFYYGAMLRFAVWGLVILVSMGVVKYVS